MQFYDSPRILLFVLVSKQLDLNRKAKVKGKLDFIEEANDDKWAQQRMPAFRCAIKMIFTGSTKNDQEKF